MTQNKTKRIVEKSLSNDKLNQNTSTKSPLSIISQLLWETFLTALIILVIFLILKYDLVLDFIS